MPVVNLRSTLYRNAIAGDRVVDPLLIKGRPVIASGTVSNAAGDNIPSTYMLCELPSACILDPSTQFKVDTWGYANIRIGTLSNPAALVSVLRSAGAIHTPHTFGDARTGRRLWDVLGLAADPGGFITLYAHGAVADPTGAGVMTFRIATIQN